jgi:hypothetical protein
MPNVSFNQSDGIEFLSLILKMIETGELRLFEDNEFIPLLIDIALVAELEFQWLIFQILYSLVRSLVPLLFYDIRL